MRQRRGAFIYQRGNSLAFTDQYKLGMEEIDLTVCVKDGTAEIWLNGVHILEAKAQFGPEAVGIGPVGGQAEFRDLMVRPL